MMEARARVAAQEVSSGRELRLRVRDKCMPAIFLTFWLAMCIHPQVFVNLFAPTTLFPLSTRS